uniref:HotDog ACOT-type domain-containing protein n=1 Tax=Megaselia scalaris TaxID=36166 RepID=T1H0M0_MEGSC
MMERIGLEHGYTPIPPSREHLLKYQPTVRDLPPRSMADSFTSAIIPLSTSKTLQDMYVSYLGHVRFGRLMQDMDAFAVWVCHQHIQIPNLDKNIHLPYTFVTIMVDKIDFSSFRPKANCDIRLSGHVSWVGTSSMEIVVWLEQEFEGKYNKITRALFLMAARNATNTGPAPVNQIEPGNENEKNILIGGEVRKKKRIDIQKQSLLKVVPSMHEQSIMHEIFSRITRKDTIQLNKRILPPNGKWMADCSIMNTIPCFPEYRNAHNKIFGGFIMKTALENSWVCAYLHAKSRPKLETICDISFEKPVDVSSFLQMHAYVIYTELNYIVVMVVADVL